LGIYDSPEWNSDAVTTGLYSIYAVVTSTIRLRFDGRPTALRLLIEDH